ncbi:MAG: formylglycine-generating enzyme family protein [Burkholderiales bacterium]
MSGISMRRSVGVVVLWSAVGAAMAAPPAGTVIRDCPECPEVVVLPIGAFTMGSVEDESGRDEDEGPAHIVTVASPFAMGKFEVTFAEWDACTAAGACERVEDDGWGRGRRPVINVGFDQAHAYARWLAAKTGQSYRLPMEAEWEYGARAGTKTSHYWGHGIDEACTQANVYDTGSDEKYRFGWGVFRCSDGFIETAPVGSFPANAFGLHDVLGNVWEWTEDCYTPGYVGAPTDGSARTDGSCHKRVSRGGGWNIYPAWVRSAYRYGLEPARRSNNLGFRIVRDVK